jgi:hypothetical protein
VPPQKYGAATKPYFGSDELGLRPTEIRFRNEMYSRRDKLKFAGGINAAGPFWVAASPFSLFRSIDIDKFKRSQLRPQNIAVS